MMLGVRSVSNDSPFILVTSSFRELQWLFEVAFDSERMFSDSMCQRAGCWLKLLALNSNFKLANL